MAIETWPLLRYAAGSSTTAEREHVTHGGLTQGPRDQVAARQLGHQRDLKRGMISAAIVSSWSRSSRGSPIALIRK